MEKAIKQRVKKALKEKLFPGCVVGVVYRTGERSIQAFGKQTYALFSRSLNERSVFDIASVTKSIPLAAVTLSLAEHRVFSLDDKVGLFIPAFGKESGKETVTLRHLLTNTVDLHVPSLSSLKDKTPGYIVERVCVAPLRSAPGTTYCYTNSSSLILSMCLKKAMKRSLGVLANEYFFDPLGMRDTTFNVRMARINPKRIVPTEIDPWRRREIRGEVHDESTYTLQNVYGLNGIGSAGLFSTAPDLLTFVEMLLNRGTFRDHTYFKEETVAAMHANHFPEASGAGGLGWTLSPQGYMGKMGSRSMFGKTGFTGCMVIVDPVKERGVFVLSNYHYPKRKTDLEPNRRFRADICDIVFS